MKELLKIRGFLILLIAQATSGLGATFATFIISWLVFELTGSLIAMGSIWVFYMVPTLFTQLWSGPFLDRWNRKKVMIFSAWARALAFLFPALMFSFNTLEIWHLYLTVVMVGLVEPLFSPSSSAYVARLLPKEKLMKGNSMLAGTAQVMLLIGPPLGALILQFIGEQAVLFSLVVIMGLGGTILFFLTNFETVNPNARESWFKQFTQGLVFYKVNPVLFWTLMLVMIFNLCTGALTPLLLPFITDVLNGTPLQFGLVTSFASLGMILGSIWLGSRKEVKNRRLMMLGGLMGSGLMIFLLGWVGVIPLVLMLITVNGFCLVLFAVNNQTLFQMKVPDELRGRVFAVRMLFVQIGVPIGALVGGIIAETIGIAMLFSTLGAVLVVATGVAFMMPTFHELNSSTTVSSEAEGMTT
jgi:MFS family permease